MKRKPLLFLLLMAMFMPLAMNAQKALPYEYGFENNDLAAEGWTTSNLEEGSGIENLSDDEENPYYVFAFQYTQNPPQFLISPQLTGTENSVYVEFEYASYAADYGAETFQVGYSTTTNATSSFTWYPEVTVTNELYYGDDFVLYSKVLPAGTKYVAVKCTSNDAWYLFLDNFSFTVPDPCSAPTNLSSSEVLVNSATLSWEGLQNTYNVRYRVPESMNYTFFEDFENGFDAQGWTTIRNGDGTEYTDWRIFDATQFSSGSVTNHSGDYVAISRSWSSTGYHVDNWLITPPVTLDGVLKFWVRDDGQYHEHYDVYVSTATNDIEDFELFYEPGDASGTWTEITVDLSRLGGVTGYIALRNTDYDQDFLLIDDFGIGTVIQAGPWQPVISNVTSPYTLTGLAAETNYEWQVQGNCSSGTTDWSSSDYFTTPSACDPPVNLVSSNVTDESAALSWTGYQNSYVVQYRTASTRETYYFNDFNEEESEGWTWTPFWIYGFPDPIYNIPGDQNYFMQLGWNSTQEETIISCELPEYPSGSVVEFYYFGYGVANTFQVGYSSTTNNLDAFGWSNPIEAPLQTYTLFSEVLPAGTKYVAFKATASSQNACIFIDDFGVFGQTIPAGTWQTVNAATNSCTLEDLLANTQYEWQVQGVCANGSTDWSVMASFTTLPSCLVPTGLEVGHETTDGAVAVWNSDATLFEIELNGVTIDDNVTEPLYIFENLDPGTHYVVRVRANCGEEDGLSDWTAPVDFYTLCDAYDLPYAYDFEDLIYENNDFICWEAFSLNNNSNNVSVQWEDDTHSNIVFAFSSYSSSDSYYQMLISPELNATTAVSVQFDYKTYYEEFDITSYEYFVIGYSTATNDISDFTFLWDDEFEAHSTDWSRYSVTFPTGTKYVAILYTSEYMYDLYLDNFRFDIGKAFVTDGDWDEANNWSPVGVPTDVDDVSIEAEAIIPADYVAELGRIVIGEEGSITIEDGGQLYQSSEFIELTMEKNITAYTGVTDNYNLLAFPLYDAGIPEEMVSEEDYDFYKFDNGQPGEEWQNDKEIGFDEVGLFEGCLYANPVDDTLSVSGYALASNTAVYYDTYYYDETENEVNGWYLLGNPYTCDAYIYNIIFDDDDNIEEIIPLNAMYYDENGEMQTIEAGPIAPMQGFFVSISEDTDVWFLSYELDLAKNIPSFKNLKKSNINSITIPAKKLSSVDFGKPVKAIPAKVSAKPMSEKTMPAKEMSVKRVPFNVKSFVKMSDKKKDIKK